MGDVERFQFYKLRAPTVGPRRFVAVAFFVIVALAQPARAIGWAPTDFLIGGGPSFTNKIGVFDSELNFMGLLDSSFVTVAGMDFDSSGHLVAVASAMREVRVYDASGAQVGGFIRSDDLLGTSADLKVTPSGSYVVATQNFGGGDGAREFAPDGTFVRQYGTGGIRAVAVIPGNRLWIGGLSSSMISVFDLDSGALLDTITITGPSGFRSMTYSANTNTVLADSGGSIWELDFSGNVLHNFTAPGVHGLGAAVRGTNGDVFATDSGQSLFRWHADGSFVGSTLTSDTLGFPYGIVWAGNIPEPASGVLVVLLSMPVLGKRLRRRVI
ncbi:MAG: hypothetical protein ACREJC_09430, partial [Tepidisphaeraceae bacterium]